MGMSIDGNECLDAKCHCHNEEQYARPRYRPIDPAETFEPNIIHDFPWLLLRISSEKATVGLFHLITAPPSPTRGG
jgi:hypothetical protein